MIDLHIGRQTFAFDCGTTALQLVMAYYGVDIRGDELMDALGTGEDGTPVSGIVRVAEEQGFTVIAKAGWTLKELKKILDQGYPVIVLVQAWADEFMTLDEWKNDYDDGHYVIVIGYSKGVLLFEDPSSFHRTWLREREFLARWHDIDTDSHKKLEHFGIVLMGKEPAVKVPKHMD